jgi:acetyl esterase/lipase
MRAISIVIIFFVCVASIKAQKKPLDHTVYDSWQSIGRKVLSNNGKWIVYTIVPQEGDQELVIQSTDAKYKKTIPRGDSAIITEDNRFVIFHIKPFYKDIREARIRKKRGDDIPKDSLGIIELGRDSIWKREKVKGYKTPEKSFGWVAYHLERKPGVPGRSSDDKKRTDSLTQIIDSLQSVIERMPKKEPSGRDISEMNFADEDESGDEQSEFGTDLVLRNLVRGEEQIFKNVLEYSFSRNGLRLLINQSKDPQLPGTSAGVIYFNLRKGVPDTLSRGGNNFKNFALTEDGSQVAYLAEREAKPKDLQKFYKLWYYREGMDSAVMLVDRNTAGMQIGMSVSEFGSLEFSKSGERLFFGCAPIRPAKDTNLIDIDLVRLDIWHYNDDYLQPVQLNRLRRDLQESFLAVYHIPQKKLVQLGSREIPQVIKTGEGDGLQFVGVTDFGKRVESQWEGTTKKDIYAIEVLIGTKKLVKKDLQGQVTAGYQSPTGKYILWYDSKAKDYFVWDGNFTRNITDKIKLPLYDEDHDSPSDASPYGVMGWFDKDSSVLIYDKYDIWLVNPDGTGMPSTISRDMGRKNKLSFRYLNTDTSRKFFSRVDGLYFRAFNNVSKGKGIWFFSMDGLRHAPVIPATDFSVGSFLVTQNVEGPADVVFSKENFNSSPDLYAGILTSDSTFHDLTGASAVSLSGENRLSFINPQQSQFRWGTAELFKWKTYNGKESEGIVFKPDNFDPNKKYPMICYFYEVLSDGLCNYMQPEPTRSRINIPFFVSRGYIVFAPDIHYSTGHPGADAFDYVVSGARALVKKGFVDSTRMGLQGQSWGGYQVAYIITATSLFKAAWAGAPVANMTSAYGGIRWESGLNRQFQYEKTQSRIGATLWDKPELYIENSPLFHLPSVKTPLVIMSNDADGAVPWYQGIELFTGMRRLGKKVWMLNYNGEAHNLVERKNKKDIQIRQQQFFDWLLMDEKPARWITEGVPAVNKGIDWGLD